MCGYGHDQFKLSADQLLSKRYSTQIIFFKIEGGARSKLSRDNFYWLEPNLFPYKPCDGYARLGRWGLEDITLADTAEGGGG